MKVESPRFSGQRLVICEYREWPSIEKDIRLLFAKSKARISAFVIYTNVSEISKGKLTIHVHLIRR